MTAVQVSDLAHAYGDRRALDGVSFSVEEGTVHGFLGPNGSGKSTLFRLLATLLPVSAGKATICGFDLASQQAEVRKSLGVVFQSPALDKKLSVEANLKYGGHLQGLSGKTLTDRIAAVLDVAKLADRRKDNVGELSGGLRRRVEVAKALLHQPKLLILDEPSTGLDPSARRDLWEFLRSRDGLTVLFTTHLMEEAESAAKLTLLDEGKIVAEDTPNALKSRVGGTLLMIDGDQPEQLASDLGAKFSVDATVLGHSVRVRADQAEELVTPVLKEFGERVTSLTVGRPSLEDAFIELTGHRLVNTEGEDA